MARWTDAQIGRSANRQVGRSAVGYSASAFLPICRSAYLPICLSAFLLLVTLPVRAQNDVIGSHDLSPAGTSPVKGGLSGSCWYCHAPHSGLNGAPGIGQMPLWNTKLSSVQAYTVYSSSTLVNKINPSPPLGTDSTLCLS